MRKIEIKIYEIGAKSEQFWEEKSQRLFLFSFNQTNIHAPSAKGIAGKGQGVKQQSLSKSYPGGNRKNLNLDPAEC